MSQEAMEAILNIADWYALLGGTFIRVFGGEKPLHVLPRYATNKMAMKEVSYHFSIGLSSGLHGKKKARWPTFPLRIRLYEINNLKDVDVEAKDIFRFRFNTKDINLYDPHGICKNHCVKVYYSWIHGTLYKIL